MTRSAKPPAQPDSDDRPTKKKKVSTHWLYIAVIVAVVAGAAVGLIFGKRPPVWRCSAPRSSTWSRC